LRQLAGQLAKIKGSFPGLFFEMAFIYRFALWDAVLPDLIGAVATTRPEIFKSKDKEKILTYQQILEQPDMSALIELIVEREMNRFGRESVQNQREWFRGRLGGIDLYTSEPQCDQVVELTARRNLLVHASGIVNQTYLETVVNSPFEPGDRVSVDFDYYNGCDSLLTAIFEGLYASLLQKFCPAG
jgi:hypothetical protein